MNKLIIALVVVAASISLATVALAGDATKLQVSVTFKADQDLIRLGELKVLISEIEQKAAKIYEIASQPDVNGDGKVDLTDIELRKQHIESLKALRDQDIMKIWNELYILMMKRPDLRDRISVVLGQSDKVKVAVTDYITKLSAMLDLVSIELNEAIWDLREMGLNEKRLNSVQIGTGQLTAQHLVKNAGTVAVSVRIGILQADGVKIGDVPGLDQISMMICSDGYNYPVPMRFVPEHKSVTNNLGPNATKQIPLILYSPTSVSPEIQGASVYLELIAGPAVIYPPYPY